MKNNGAVKTVTRIGPRDHGRRMSLRDYEFAEVQEGYIYELSRGVITVSNVPNYPHARRMTAIRNPLIIYQVGHPEIIYDILAGSDCKLLAWDYESERHPDISVYLTPPPSLENPWRKWNPGIVVEIVSRGSRKRDYQQKPEEYWALGVKEYWIVDADKAKITALQRGRSKWKEVVLGPDDIYETKLLPGFKLDCRSILES